jgi:PAS domain S-box-containing protein
MNAATTPAHADTEEEISALIATLHATGKRLEELTGGEVDAVADSEGGTFLLRRAQERLRHRQAAKQAAILDALPAHIAMLDAQGVILTVNEAWRQFAGKNVLQHPDYTVGLNYLEVCENAQGDEAEDARAVAEGIRAVLDSGGDFAFEYSCHSPTEQCWFLLRVTPLAVTGPRGAVVMHINITERKLAEEAMQKQQTELRVLFDLMPAMIWFKDTQNGILRVNRRVAESAGRSVEEIEGKPSLEIYPEDAARFYADDLEVILSGVPKMGYVESVQHSPGQTVWVQTDKVPYCDRDGKVIGIVVMAQDITARKNAEMEVRFSEQRYRSLMEATTAIVWDTPASGMFEVVQPRWADFTGQSFEEYRGWGWLSAVHIDDQRETARIWSAAVASRSIYKVEHRLRTRDQTYRHMMVHAVPILGEDGSIRQWIGIHTDVTERKQAEQHIAEQAALIDESRDAITVCDLDRRITFWSKGAERLYGWNSDEAKGCLAHKLFQMDAEKLKTADKTVRETGEWNGEILKTARRGTVLTVDGRWTLMRDPQGRPHSILMTDTDVTERKKIEKQFLRSQRMESIGTLAGGIAHDLNNVLAPILMGVDFLKMKYPDATVILDRFETCANRGAAMVRQLLTFAKGAEGERVSVQTAHLVTEIKELMLGTFPKNIQLEVSCEPGLPTVLGDASQLHQILLNLCVNARDAMASGGTLTLEAWSLDVDATFAAAVPDARPGRYVVLQVRDTGTGIPPAVLERIFDPFFTTKGPDKGTGLGLSTVMGIVKGLGGFLQVYSTPGEGSTFSVHLPAEVNAGDLKRLADVDAPRSGQGETILLVDDEAGVLEVGRLVLTALNYKVVTAIDGTEGLVKAIQHRDELRAVITDMHMPHMDGLAFARAFRRVLPDTPVIIGSGRLDAPTIEELKLLCITHRLDKPYTQHVLASMLSKVLAVGKVHDS